MVKRNEVIRWFPLDRIGDLEHAIDVQLTANRASRRRDALACALGLMGLRVTEICNLECRDLEVGHRRLYVHTIKGGRDRRIQLSAALTASLQAMLGDRTDGPLLVSNRGGLLSPKRPQQMAERIFHLLLGNGHQLTFHSLRHTFAMRLYAATRDPYLVQRELGHASIKTTEVYARSLESVPESVLVKVGQMPVQPGQQLPLFRIYGA